MKQFYSKKNENPFRRKVIILVLFRHLLGYLQMVHRHNHILADTIVYVTETMLTECRQSMCNTCSLNWGSKIHLMTVVENVLTTSYIWVRIKCTLVLINHLPPFKILIILSILKSKICIDLCTMGEMSK